MSDSENTSQETMKGSSGFSGPSYILSKDAGKDLYCFGFGFFYLRLLFNTTFVNMYDHR